MAVVVIGTGNAGKRRELLRLLGDVEVDWRSLADYPDAPEVDEDGETLAANARKKALAYARWTGEVALADDSGLEVDALGGAPGVHSARYAGIDQDSEANLAKLLAELDGVAVAERSARFRCVIAVAHPTGATLLTEGACEGRILTVRAGEGGFGYDPVFYYEPAGRAFAQMSSEEKNAVSHRAEACRALRPHLRDFVAAPR